MERKAERPGQGKRDGEPFEGLRVTRSFDRLEAALQRIPKRQRAIFLAVRLDNMSFGEIAEQTGLSVKQVRRQVTKALLRLDDELRERVPWWRRLLNLIGGEDVR